MWRVDSKAKHGSGSDADIWQKNKKRAPCDSNQPKRERQIPNTYATEGFNFLKLL